MSDVITSTTDTETSPAASGSVTDKPATTATAAAEKSTASGAEHKEPKETEEKEEGEIEAGSKDPAASSPKSAEKRIKKLIGRATAAEQELARLRGELERTRTPKETAATESNSEALPEGRPKQDDFKTHEAYEDALHDWREARAAKKNETKAKVNQEQTEIQTKVELYRKGVKAVQEKYDDHDSVVNDCDVDVPKHVQKLLIESENGPELSYLLAKNEDELERISKLDPVAAARAIGKFEALHIKAPEASEPANKTTNAPTPISTVGSRGSASAPKGLYDDNLSYDEFKKLREQKKG